jgi:UDP-glucuronate decarboxylase
VDDLVEGLLRMMDTPAGFTGPLNLGNPQELTVLELAQTILRLTGSRSKLVMKPLPEDDPRQRQPDIAMAREALAWTPSVGLEDGLRETIAYFRRLTA